MDTSLTSIDCGVEAVEDGPQRPDPAVARDLEAERVVVAGCRRPGCGRPGPSSAASVKREPDVAAGDQALELVRRALGDEPPVVEDADPVGEVGRPRPGTAW